MGYPTIIRQYSHGLGYPLMEGIAIQILDITTCVIPILAAILDHPNVCPLSSAMLTPV